MECEAKGASDKRSPKQREAYHYLALAHTSMAALSMHDCLVVTAGQAIARAAINNDGKLRDLALELVRLAQEVK